MKSRFIINSKNRFVLLLFIMVFITIITSSLFIILLYNAAIEREKDRLLEIAQNQAYLIESVGKFDSTYNNNTFPGGSRAATISQVIDSHKVQKRRLNSNHSVVFLLGEIKGNQIEFLQTHDNKELIKPVPIDSKLAEPMRNALLGKSGVMVGLDYQGIEVLAAYEPVTILNLGIVAKVNMSEVRGPFVNASIIGGVIGLILIFVGVLLFRKLNESVIDDLLNKNTEIQLQGQILSTMAEGVILIKTSNGEIVYSNPKFEEMFGYHPGELIGKSVPVINAPTNKDPADVAAEIINELNQSGSWSGDVYSIKKDGTKFWCSANVSGLSHPVFGEVWVSVHTDINEKKKTEKNLIVSKIEAQKANIIKSDFLASMSHEIRTPMNGIFGIASLLKNTKLTKEQEKFVDIINSSSLTLLQIVNDILDFSKIEANQLKLEISTFNLNTLFAELLSLFNNMLVEKDDRLKYEINPSLPAFIKGDLVRIKQILLNLISNAIKFTDHGKISVSVNVQSQQGEEIELIIMVKDNGIGIPEESHKHIFESFNQGNINQAMNYQGTGLGLAICGKLVQLMDGKIWVESKSGEGSTFYFTIKVKESLETIDSSHQNSLPVSNSESLKLAGYYPLNILIADDNKINQLVAKKIIESFGYTPTISNDGSEALKLLKKQSFDLIFMDIIMPVMGGIEAAQRITDEYKDSRPTIIAMTANAMIGDKENYLSQGMDDYLAKPIFPEQVYEIIKKWGIKRVI